MALAMKVKKGDLVQVLSGKDRGKQGRVIDARPDERRVIVENLNVVKRHTKPLAVSKVMVVCPTCNLPTRVGHTFKEIKGKRVKVRVCKRHACGGELDK